jgi:hypothetical protein
MSDEGTDEKAKLSSAKFATALRLGWACDEDGVAKNKKSQRAAWYGRDDA